jgi:hypothetical protein
VLSDGRGQFNRLRFHANCPEIGRELPGRGRILVNAERSPKPQFRVIAKNSFSRRFRR